MKYPNLVPENVCHTTVRVLIGQGGVNRDGSPKQDFVFEGKCFYSEKTKQRLNADKKLITILGEALFSGDIAPEVDIITGELQVIGKNTTIKRNIERSEKAKNPDGTVNYTRLELV